MFFFNRTLYDIFSQKGRHKRINVKAGVCIDRADSSCYNNKVKVGKYGFPYART